MGFRVQFTITDAEKAQLEAEAKAQDYPNLAALCKARALGEKATYGALYQTMVEKIKAMPEGTKFFLRDLVDTPPALLGRWLYDNVANGSIPNVRCLGRQGADAAQYEKVLPGQGDPPGEGAAE